MVFLKRILPIFLLFLISFTSCTKKQGFFSAQGLFANVQTSKGSFIIKLYEKEKPITVGNFVGLVEGTINAKDVAQIITNSQKLSFQLYRKNKNIKYNLEAVSRDKTLPAILYKQTLKEATKLKKTKTMPFYNGLVFHKAQPDLVETGCPFGTGVGGPGYTIPHEKNDKLSLKNKAMVAMASNGYPNSGGSRFFINKQDLRNLDEMCSIFGAIIDGYDVISDISQNDRILSISILRGTDYKRYHYNSEDLSMAIVYKEYQAISHFFKDVAKIVPGVIQTKTGLLIAPPSQPGIAHSLITSPDTEIILHYVIRLFAGGKKGKILESSYINNEPLIKPVKEISMVGLQEAAYHLEIGEKKKFYIHYNIGLGKDPIFNIPGKLMLEIEAQRFGSKEEALSFSTK